MNEVWVRIVAAFIAIAVTVITILAIEDSKDDEKYIPVPPPGYEYCVTADGKSLKFCERE